MKKAAIIIVITMIMALAAGCSGGSSAQESAATTEQAAAETQQETTTEANSVSEETTTEPETTVAKIKVSVTADGKTLDIETAEETVEEILKENDITLGEADLVAPAINEKVKDGDSIVVKRVTFEEVSEEEEIPYEVVETYSESMDYGTSAISQEGENGIRKITYTVMYIDGEEAGREVASEEIVRDPVSEIVVYGTYVYEEPYEEPEEEGVYEVSRIDYPNCADGSHGYTEIQYSDGSVEYVEY